MATGQRIPFQRHTQMMLHVVEVAHPQRSVFGVAHAKLKLENVMRVRGDHNAVRVIDYGMADYITDRACGTITPRDFMCASNLPLKFWNLLLCDSSMHR